jgi:hypothetical protein
MSTCKLSGISGFKTFGKGSVKGQNNAYDFRPQWSGQHLMKWMISGTKNDLS